MNLSLSGLDRLAVATGPSPARTQLASGQPPARTQLASAATEPVIAMKSESLHLSSSDRRDSDMSYRLDSEAMRHAPQIGRGGDEERPTVSALHAYADHAVNILKPRQAKTIAPSPTVAAAEPSVARRRSLPISLHNDTPTLPSPWSA